MTKALAFVLLCILLHTHADTISRHTLDLSAYLGRVTQCPAFSTSNADNSACIMPIYFFYINTKKLAERVVFDAYDMTKVHYIHLYSFHL